MYGTLHKGDNDIIIIIIIIIIMKYKMTGPDYLSRYRDSQRVVWSGDRIPVESRFSATVQTGSEAHPASYTMGTGSFLGGKAAGAWR